MEKISSKLKERETPSPHNPSNPTNTNNGNGGVGIPITTRSDPNSPYPTTFVTADTSSFKQVVQMLTGSSDSSPRQPPPPPSKNFVIPPIKTPQMKHHQNHHHHHHHHHQQQQQQMQQGFKLYERRNSAAFKNMMINAHRQNASLSPRNNYKQQQQQSEILSPSLLDFPALTLSPVTPLTDFEKSSPSVCGSDEEDRTAVIAEKGFYSPISTPRDSEPQLLPLFPLSSPRVSNN